MTLTEAQTELIAEVEHEFLRVDQAAVFLDTHPYYVRRLTGSGKLPTTTVFGLLVIPRTALEAEAERREARRERIARNRALKTEAKAKAGPEGFQAWTVLQLRDAVRAQGLRPGTRRKAELIILLEAENFDQPQPS